MQKMQPPQIKSFEENKTRDTTSTHVTSLVHLTSLSFFSPALRKQTTDLTIHNLSNYKLTTEDMQLLDKGLTFSPPHLTTLPKTCSH